MLSSVKVTQLIEISGRWMGEGGEVVAEAVDGDWALVLVRDSARAVVHAAFAQLLDDDWHYKGGGTLPGMFWVNDGTGRDLGVVGAGGTSSSDTVTIEFGGEEFVVPALEGYFAWLHRDVPSHVYPDAIRP